MFYCSDGCKSLLLKMKFAATLLWRWKMHEKMLIFDKEDSHISTIRVKFRWTKHIRQLEPKLIKESFGKSTRRLCSIQFIVGTIESFKVQDQTNPDARIILILKKSKTCYLLLIIKKAWYELMMKWKQKVLKDSSPLIDGLLTALNTEDCNLNSQEEENVAKEMKNSGMKIWKINCSRKVPLEMLCLVDEGIKHIKSYITRIYWENQALTDESTFHSDRYLWTSYAS